jgi:transcription-repair coupling factor (superfamily II helicase)
VVETLNDISARYKTLPQYDRVCSLIRNPDITSMRLKGLAGSSNALFIKNLLLEFSGLHFILLSDKDEAAYFFNDLQALLGTGPIIFFPSSYKRSVQYNQTDDGNIILRINTLNKLCDYKTGLLVIVTYPEAIAEKVVSQNFLERNTLYLSKGELISINFIREVLETYRFEFVDFVYEPGQYAIRGSIVDIFSFSAEYPYRIDFFGDEVESIRSFDIESQLSKQQLENVSIVPNVFLDNGSQIKQSIFRFATDKPIIWSNDLNYVAEKLDEIYHSLLKAKSEQTEVSRQLYLKEEFIKELKILRTIEFGNLAPSSAIPVIEFNSRPQPNFRKNFRLLGDDLKMSLSKVYDTIILSDNEKQFERLRDIFNDTHNGIPFNKIQQILHEGFIDDDLQLCCYTDHQIFDRYHKYRLHQYYSGKPTITLNELKDLKPGDYVVHIDHGIGRFGGLEKIRVNDKVQEAVRLVYRDNDILYVSIHSLHRISKYKGKDDSEPKIHKLGTGAWQKLKENTKKKVKDIAKDLIALYAKRKVREGFRFSPDTYMQEELEASFIYEDTPDQLKSTQAVKSDMESSVPMDRLICGDVGFGKTEIAIRAAFKAVADDKQVAILVPTTILALQHYTTFRERLKDFPCKVEYVSRLRKSSTQHKILAELETGRVDILIGTHRLLGKDIRFKDLGLLIIDEEQKFGVSAKEKLRSMKIDVDTLILTATPIPRTLQFSLLGARDLSVINTPPPNRHPINTELHVFNEDIIREGINFEASRGGQVFFIHNRVDTIYEIENLIKKLCPNVKTVVGHGQLEGAKLEQIMVEFIHGDYDVLVATTIIESGLDIPNANTIFINNAQNFGLSDLHQLRGRVGRSNKRAFCYLMAPLITTLTAEARRRLKAIEELSDLGSGFNISLQDLDIRGAGNLLGAEQSGFIADIGFETYNRILNEAIQELKENEFKELYSAKESELKDDDYQKHPRRFTTDCVIETDLEIHIPDMYVSNITERMRLYRQIDSLENEEELDEFIKSLTDRFGPVPATVMELLQIVRLRWHAEMTGFEKLVLKNEVLIGYFISNQDSEFYNSHTFRKMLNFVQKKPDMFKMREVKSKLTLTITPVISIENALTLFKEMYEAE